MCNIICRFVDLIVHNELEKILIIVYVLIAQKRSTVVLPRFIRVGLVSPTLISPTEDQFG